MKIGIYNRYWNTCGGGEKHIGAIAEVLSKIYPVELISTESVEWEKIEARLSLDLSKCIKIQWPNESCNDLSYFSQKYDIFINSTYNSLMIPRGKVNIYMCFFPQKLHNVFNLKNILKLVYKKLRYIFNSFSSSEKYKGYIKHGAYELESDGRIWLKETAAFIFPRQNSSKLTLKLCRNSYSGIRLIRINNEIVEWCYGDEDSLVLWSQHFLKSKTEIIIESDAFIPSASSESNDSRRLGFSVDIFRTNNLRIPNIRSDDFNPPDKEIINKYQIIISNSHFTSRWIEKRWGRKSHLIQPFIDVELFNFNDYSRNNVILSVGRFFNGSNNKKQLEIINFFKRLVDEKVINNSWVLILAGACHTEKIEHIKYLELLYKNIKNYNIEIKTDISHDELLSLYKKSSIYIHASGLGEDIGLNPENFEHFGITTCEAMSCGCIPVVYDAAGQSEIVNNENVGFKFRDYQQLKNSVQKILSMDALNTRSMRNNARARITEYSKNNFEKKVEYIIKIYE